MHTWQRCCRKIVSAWIFCLGLVFSFSLQAGQGGRWAAIKPLAVRYHFGSMREAKLKTIIQGEDGKPQYILECYSSQTVPQTGEFMYSGDFECRLHSFENKDRESTLLTELPNADRDWESRGRFLVEQLVAPCVGYRNLGRERSFRLRGFRLDLNLTNITFDNSRQSFSGTAPGLKSFDLAVLVEPDSAATSGIASPPTLPRLKSLPEACQKAFDTLYLDQFRSEGAHSPSNL
jgi:hypothetical protein